jgi:hypothetical protein
MRYTNREIKRIATLGAVSLLALGVVVFLGGGDDNPDGASAPATANATAGPTAAEQLADAEAAATPTVVPTPGIGDRSEADIEIAGSGTYTGALTGPIRFGSSIDVENEVTFSVAVEDGIGVTATAFARVVDEALADPRSWAAADDLTLVRIERDGDFQIVVASPETTDALCSPMQTIGQLSCAINDVIAINLIRWETASAGWTADIETYRTWVINHEIGHQVFGTGHRQCPAAGQLAPIMQQQSIALDGCIPNPWPYPDGLVSEPTPAPTPPTYETGADTADEDTAETVTE